MHSLFPNSHRARRPVIIAFACTRARADVQATGHGTLSDGLTRPRWSSRRERRIYRTLRQKTRRHECRWGRGVGRYLGAEDNKKGGGGREEGRKSGTSVSTHQSPGREWHAAPGQRRRESIAPNIRRRSHDERGVGPAVFIREGSASSEAAVFTRTEQRARWRRPSKGQTSGYRAETRGQAGIWSILTTALASHRHCPMVDRLTNGG